ncbi:MAG: nucleoside triphosphate pyrophosphatase [Gammaproteobacteria bacterium]
MSGTRAPRDLVLASSSPYRRELLNRLGLSFAWAAPAIDETQLADEQPETLVRRLALAKARALGDQYRHALLIGSDQVAVIDTQVLGKPGNRARAIEQLRAAAGCEVVFLTSLCLLDAQTGEHRIEVVPTMVRFRALGEAQLAAYVDREQPYDCAGSFKAEGLGIALFESIRSDDPTALIGLPLIALTRLLAAAGVDVLSSA